MALELFTIVQPRVSIFMLCTAIVQHCFVADFISFVPLAICTTENFEISYFGHLLLKKFYSLLDRFNDFEQYHICQLYDQ